MNLICDESPFSDLPSAVQTAQNRDFRFLTFFFNLTQVMWYTLIRQCAHDIRSSSFWSFARKAKELEVFGFTIAVRLECIPRFISEHIFYRLQTDGRIEHNTAYFFWINFFHTYFATISEDWIGRIFSNAKEKEEFFLFGLEHLSKLCTKRLLLWHLLGTDNSCLTRSSWPSYHLQRGDIFTFPNSL